MTKVIAVNKEKLGESGTQRRVSRYLLQKYYRHSTIETVRTTHSVGDYCSEVYVPAMTVWYIGEVGQPTTGVYLTLCTLIIRWALSRRLLSVLQGEMSNNKSLA